MNSKLIGRIIKVDNFRITIELEPDLKSLYKSGFEDIYEIARINSYVVLPVADEKVIALVTKVMLDDDPELKTLSGTITLPKSRRYLVATMIGTINSRSFVQGVDNYPILDNPVWYITEEELQLIFDQNNDSILSNEDYFKSYFLPIGTSPNFKNFSVKVNPDKMFGKHTAILGNTGSGKSCTVSTILQSLYEHTYPSGDKSLAGNVIIFDTNGEYSRAFSGNNDVNCLTIKSEDLHIPYWFMNWDDFDYMFKPSIGTQAPILKRALELSRNNSQNNDQLISSSDVNLVNQMRSILVNYQHDTSNSANLRKQGNQNRSLYNEQNKMNTLFKRFELNHNFNYKDSKIVVNGIYYNNQGLYSNEIDNYISMIDELINKINEDYSLFSQSVDKPLFFSFKELIEDKIDKAIDEQERSMNSIREFISPLVLRMKSYLTDERFSEPFLFNYESETVTLTDYLSWLFGFRETPKKTNSDKKHQITILDMSMLSSDVLENITGVVGRLILEFLQRIQKVSDSYHQRGNLPVLIVLEEAQYYIPDKNKTQDRISISKRVFERIAREGRKYGLGLILSSQRPSELSKTILSQCNTFIVHRLQNPEDQKYVRQLISSANEDLLNQLPILPQQHAIIMGDGVRSPVQVKLRDVNPEPDSSNPKFIEKWLKKSMVSVEKVVNSWVDHN